MLKGVVLNQAVTADTNIPFTITQKSNNNVTYDITNNTFVFNTIGYYDLYITLVGDGFGAGNVTLTEYVDGVPSPNAISTFVSAGTTDVMTFNIIDTIKVVGSGIGNRANVSYRLSANGIAVSANVVIEGRK